MNPQLIIDVLLLLLAANGAPVVVARLLGERWAWPVDGGARFTDGRPLFGPSKTWRGLLSGVLLTAIVSQLLGFGLLLGMLFGAASLAGDLSSSFIKRRLGVVSSDRALLLDQIPEALLPLLVCRQLLGLDLWSMAWLVLLFVVGALLLSRIMYRLGIRRRPY